MDQLRQEHQEEEEENKKREIEARLAQKDSRKKSLVWDTSNNNKSPNKSKTQQLSKFISKQWILVSILAKKILMLLCLSFPYTIKT